MNERPKEGLLRTRGFFPPDPVKIKADSSRNASCCLSEPEKDKKQWPQLFQTEVWVISKDLSHSWSKVPLLWTLVKVRLKDRLLKQQTSQTNVDLLRNHISYTYSISKTIAHLVVYNCSRNVQIHTVLFWIVYIYYHMVW